MKDSGLWLADIVPVLNWQNEAENEIVADLIHENEHLNVCLILAWLLVNLVCVCVELDDNF